MKKMYNTPKIEISKVSTTHLMDGLLGSGSAPQPGMSGAPKGDIIEP